MKTQLVPQLLDLMQSGSSLQLGHVNRAVEQAFPEWLLAVKQALAENPENELRLAEWQSLPLPVPLEGGRYEAVSLRHALASRLTWLSAVVRAFLEPGVVTQGSIAIGLEISSPDPRNVFVIHGRNETVQEGIFNFLRAIGLHPLEWSQLLLATDSAAPYIFEVLDTGLRLAQAIVVVMTPDDEGRLKEQFRKATDAPHEVKLTPQARLNVIFEAGMAIGRAPKRTVLVELGGLRPFSDIGGIHTVRLNNSSVRRQELAQRLRSAGCTVDLTGTEWHRVGNFDIDA